MRYARFAVLALLLGTAKPTEAAQPIEAFVAIPKYSGVAISPGGTLLALMKPEDDKSTLTFFDFPSMKPAKAVSFGDRNDIQDIRWVDEKRLLIRPARLMPGVQAYGRTTGEIVRVDADTGKIELIFGQFEDQRNAASHLARRETVVNIGSILTTKTSKPDEVLVETVAYGTDIDSNSVYRMNVKNGKLDAVASSSVRGARFITGADQRVSVSYGMNAEGKSVVYYQRSRDDKVGGGIWILKVASDEGDFHPVAWAGKGEEYYAIDGRAAATRGVVIWDAEKNTQRLLYRNPEVDMRAAAFDPTGRPWLFAAADYRPVYWYPDPEHPLARMHRALAKGLPQDYISVVSQTDDLSVAVVRIESGKRPPTFLVVDVPNAKPLQVMQSYPSLPAKDLAPVSPIEFPARDGLRIRGYLTTPLASDGKPGRKLPMLVMVHDGPFADSDDYVYDSERQLFASRGYAVLQVNFRGSGGRGREFEQAGNGEWGRKVQDDITDGVRWAIQDGVADANHICILGGRLGGYAALVGVSREPTMFKCAVGLTGFYDLALYSRDSDQHMATGWVTLLKDSLGRDEAELRARSPISSAKSIQAKVLLMQRAEDFSVPIEHAERMRKALNEAGNPPEWIMISSAEQGVSIPKSRADGYGRILDFIDRNIGH